MANKKVTDLDPIATAPVSGVMHFVDTTDTTQNAAGSSFKVTKEDLLKENTAAILLNTAKTGITTDQASAIVLNTTKVGYTDALVNANATVVASAASLLLKTDKGSFTGTSKDLENLIIAASTGASGKSIIPTSAVPSGTGIASFTATQAGTYTNYGGVVVNTNSFAIISRSAAGVFSISQTAFDLTTYAKVVDVNNLYNKITGITFTNNSYLINTTGAIASFTGLSYTNLIPLEGVNVIKSIIYTLGNSASYLLYDVNQVLISAPINTKNSLTIPEVIFIPITSNVKFIRFVTTVAQQPSFFVDIISLKTNELETLTANLAITNKLVGVIVNNEDIILPNIATQASVYFNVNGVITNFAGAGNNYNISLDYIPVIANNSYKLNFAMASGYVVFYDSQKNIISTIASSSDIANYIFTTPASTAYVRTTYNRTLGLKLFNNGIAYLQPKESTTSVETTKTPITQGVSTLGALEFEPIPTTGYSHVIFNGQSLSVGAVSIQPISTVALTDCFMIGANVETFSNTLTPLVSAVIGNSGEQPIVGAVNAFKKYLNKTPYRNTKIIASSVGKGAQTIEQLSKNRTELNGLTTGNLYNTKFIASLDSAKIAVGSTPLSCSAIVWMQGEANQDPTDYAGTGLTTSLPQTHDKATYKSLLKQLKTDMQTDIMAKYGQSFKPLFYVYQTSNQYTFSGNIPITQAQYELAQEEEDVILLNPHYYCPTAQGGGGHLNANGYRWYGEQVGKTLFSSLSQNNEFNPSIPRKFTIDAYYIYIDCYVPVAPLVIDTKAIELQTGFGFTVKLNGVAKTVSNVEIIGGTTVKLTVAADMTTGTVDVSYGGSVQSGKGNIRDSDRAISFSKYVDDTTLTSNNPPYTALDSNGVNFYGKRYPLWNWLSNFYINIQ